MLMESLKLTVVGMGFVGLFLLLMIGFMILMSKIFHGTEEDEQMQNVSEDMLQDSTVETNNNLIAVIGAAIRKFQERK